MCRTTPAALSSLLLFFAGVLSAAGPLPAPEIENAEPAEEVEAPEGHVLVSWDFAAEAAGQDVTFELQQDLSPRFTQPVTRQVGTDTASVLSGLPEGEVHIRVRAVGADGSTSAWSKPLQVEVSYPPDSLLRNLSILGLILFVSTVGLIWRGHHRTQTPSSP